MDLRRTRKIYNFYHDIHPPFIGTLAEFSLAYPEMSPGQIVHLTGKNVKNSGGWRKTPENQIEVRRTDLDTKHTWYNKDGSVFTGSIRELIDTYQQHVYIACYLYKVALGEIRYHRDWSLSPDNFHLHKKHLWKHIKTGITEYLSFAEMMAKYPYLKASNLSSLKLGKINLYYGWARGETI